MNVVMNCDDVFDVLTRGPFPAGRADDGDVELHLRACHECRELAEALRPAVHLFHESLADQQEHGLPTYLGRVQEAIHATRPAPPARLGLTRAASHWFEEHGRLLIGGLLGMAATLVIWFAGSQSHTARNAHVAEGKFMRGDPDRVTLVSLGLPLSCLSAPSDRSTAGTLPMTRTRIDMSPAVRSEFVCCTRCHYSGGNSPLMEQKIRTLTTACAACHQTTPSPSENVLGVRLQLPNDSIDVNLAIQWPSTTCRVAA